MNLFEEKHLLICRQWPEVVGHEGFQLVAGGPHPIHHWNDLIPHKLSVPQGVTVVVGFDRLR